MKSRVSLQQLISRYRFLRFGLILTIINIFGGALGYIYQITMGRILHPAEFALFSTIMALLAFFSAPMNAISMLIVRKVSTLKAYGSLDLIKSLLLKINKIFLIISLIIFILLTIVSSHLQLYIKAESFTQIIIFSFVLILSFFITACMAFMQGLQTFTLMGVFGLLGILIKFLIGVVLVKYGFGVDGALFGVLLAMILVYIFTISNLLYTLKPYASNHSIDINLSSFKNALPVLIATISFTAMTQLDMVLINWYFTPKEAANYAAASILGKAVLYLPGGLILALFPMVSEDYAKGKNSFELFRQAVFLTLGACGSIAGLYWFFGELIVSILYGNDYKGAGEILRWYGFAILPLTIVLIAEQYLIAKGRVLFSWLFLILLPLELVAIHIWHTKILEIVAIIGIFGALLAIIGYILMWRSTKFN